MKDMLRKKVEECADKILKHERLVDFEGIQDFCSICGYPLGKEQKKALREFVIKNILSIINQEVIKGKIEIIRDFLLSVEPENMEYCGQVLMEQLWKQQKVATITRKKKLKAVSE